MSNKDTLLYDYDSACGDSVMSLNKCAVLGSPIKHSLSPVLFSAAFSALDLNWKYFFREVTAEQLADLLNGCDQSWRGFSVTMPCKIAALAAADQASERAELIGAANTLYRGPQMQWIADNTDIDGIRAAIIHAGYSAENHDSPAGIVILGAGGTARAAIAAASEFGVPITVAARNITKAYDLNHIAHALNISIKYIDFTDEQLKLSCAQAGVVISTLPLGVIPERFFPAICSAQAVIDVLYTPWPTPLVSYARGVAKKNAVVGGLTMLLYQAFTQCERITGHRAPRAQMAAALSAATSVNIPIDLMTS